MVLFTTEQFFEAALDKFAWVGFEPTTTEYCSEALTN